uniref:Sulfotransferase domain-containing protein n=1 Tax=viral metagenome TaxID=1070528 RepID=A0A6C0E6V0_9ZZZZ
MFSLKQLLQQTPKKNYNADVVVYCGGKCGSSTLEATFTKNGYKTIRAHGIKDWNTRFPNGPGIMSIIKDNSRWKKIYIIDAYRTPIERKISSFFQNIAKHVPEYARLSLTELINIFNTRFLSTLEKHHSIDEVMHEFNVPLFTEFDFNNGYVMKEHNNMVFVKILFRDISKWGQILCSIFGRNIPIHSDNITVNKGINTLYTAFKAAYRLPASYLPTLDNDSHFHIYNTPDEQEKYIAYWKLKTKS